MLAKEPISDLRVSVIFETKAILPPDAPKSWNLPYLDLVVAGKTSLSPHFLLKALKKIEKLLGRDFEAPRWSPRTIDLDILAYDDLVMDVEELTIPHKELVNRPFFLSLMATLQPRWRYPVKGHPYSNLTLDEITHRFIPTDDHMVKCFASIPQLVGILNVTPDSFSDGGKYLNPEQIFNQIQKLVDSGAAVIDIGAQSTRPGATRLSIEEEWERLEPVFNLLAQEFSKQGIKPLISLDTFYPEIVRKAHAVYNLDWINDVKGGEDRGFHKFLKETDCRIVVNHSLGIPPSRDVVLPFNENPMDILMDWAKEKVEIFDMLGIKRDRVILDPGIGFGKSAFQNMAIFHEIERFKEFGCDVLIGHSRKAFFKTFTHAVASERDYETIGVSYNLMKKGVDYLRVHDVASHHRSLSMAAI